MHAVAWFLIAFYFHGISVSQMPSETACYALVQELTKNNGVPEAKCVKVDE
jgi:hypothetical protein